MTFGEKYWRVYLDLFNLHLRESWDIIMEMMIDAASWIIVFVLSYMISVSG